MNTKYDNFSLKFSIVDEESKKQYYSEIINSISWASFAKDEHLIVSWDYLNVKVWDVRKSSEEMMTYNYKIFNFIDIQL